MTGRERALGEHVAHSKTSSFGHGPETSSTSPLADLSASSIEWTLNRREFFLDGIDPYSVSKNLMPHDEYARSYPDVRAPRVIYFTRTRIIEHAHGARATIMHCAWHDCGHTDASDVAARRLRLTIHLVNAFRSLSRLAAMRTRR
jgi:hypothetical protein